MYGKPQHEGGYPVQVQPRVEEAARSHEQDEEHEGRRRQEGHEVVPHRERQDERHEDEKFVVAGLADPLLPAEGEP